MISKETNNLVAKEMKDVIETSKKVRNFLTDDDIEFADKLKNINIFKQVINANKNIVSASIVLVNTERYGTTK